MGKTESTTCAAFFDFDGIFFQPGTSWKFTNATLGRPGSRVSCEDGYRLFLNIREENPDATLENYFYLDESSYEIIKDHRQDNIAPISQLLHFAKHHLFRRDELFIIAPAGFMEYIIKITDLAFESTPNLALFENPFCRAENLYPPEKEPSLILDEKKRPALKTLFYTSFLKETDNVPETIRLRREEFNSSDRLYNKIFLYHTERALDTHVHECLHNEMDLYTDGRNAIVTQYIVRLDNAG